MGKVKKNLHFLTLKERDEILQKIEKGVKQRDLAFEYKVDCATICRIKKQSRSLKENAYNSFSLGNKRKTLRFGNHPELEKRLYQFFMNQRRRNAPVSSLILKSKALKIFDEIKKDGEQFNASDGWFSRFKKRFGLRYLTVTGESLSCDPEAIEPFKEKLTAKIAEKGYVTSQIYNADETGLFWKLLPNKTYVSKDEKSAPGNKVSKDRISVLLCANGDGSHKIKPLTIGKSMNPRCFKNFRLPVNYASNKTAWMTRDIFKKWFFDNFVEEVKKFAKENDVPPKALLLLDQAPSHPPEEELVCGEIEVMYFPANCTAILQPMDQGVINLTKIQYKTLLMETIISEKDSSLHELLKKIDLKTAVIMLSQAWGKLLPETIAKCWKSVLGTSPTVDAIIESNPDDMPLDIEIDDPLLVGGLQRLNEMVENYVGEADTDEIRNWVLELGIDEGDSEANEPEDTTQEETTEKVQHESIFGCVNTILKWGEQNDVLSFNQIACLHDIRSKALEKCYEKTQSKITKFFQKK